jgi:tRNA(fMet)-specific endonuclease VapC
LDVNGAQIYLLDTNIASYITSGKSQAARNALKRAADEHLILISSLTEAELRFGLRIKPQAARLRGAVESMLQSLEIRPWDSSAALAYAELRAQLGASGKALANMDLLIAAHAIGLGAVLVSHDRAFKHAVPHLTVVDWATDLQ